MKITHHGDICHKMGLGLLPIQVVDSNGKQNLGLELAGREMTGEIVLLVDNSRWDGRL